MSINPSTRQVGALAALAMLAAGAGPALAHTIVGDRVFPATLTIDDPGVNDELALPTFSYLDSTNPDGTAGPISYALGWEYAKTITADLGFSVGSDGVTFQRNPKATGWANIETQLKYVFYQNPQHEFIVAGAVNVEIGHTGGPPSSSLPSDPFSTVTLKAYAGKGFGDASADWLRPFAVTAEVDYSIPTTGINYIDGSLNPTTVTYGGTLQYSLLYRNAYISEVPDLFKKLIPAFEVILTTPVANTGPGVPGVPVHVTTGVVGPSVYYIGSYFEIGVMAQIPVNSQSGRHVGALAVLDFFLDDIAPNTLGKPLFGPASSTRAATY
jgi:hypothetical protein